MIKWVFISLFIFCSTTLPAWELVLDQGGIKIFKRKHANSKIHEIKGTATIPWPMLEVLSVVLDYKNFHKWQPNLITFERLKVVNDKEFINYAASKMPWPVKPRDMIMRAHFIIDFQKRWFHVAWQETTWSSKPVTSKFVRVPKSRAMWSLKPINKRMTRIEFKALGDPGGWIPSWLVNWFSRYMLADNFKRLEKFIAKKNFNKDIMHQFQYIREWY